MREDVRSSYPHHQKLVGVSLKYSSPYTIAILFDVNKEASLPELISDSFLSQTGLDLNSGSATLHVLPHISGPQFSHC